MYTPKKWNFIRMLESLMLIWNFVYNFPFIFIQYTRRSITFLGRKVWTLRAFFLGLEMWYAFFLAQCYQNAILYSMSAVILLENINRTMYLLNAKSLIVMQLAPLWLTKDHNWVNHCWKKFHSRINVHIKITAAICFLMTISCFWIVLYEK